MSQYSFTLHYGISFTNEKGYLVCILESAFANYKLKADKLGGYVKDILSFPSLWQVEKNIGNLKEIDQHIKYQSGKS
jgi:hypothetical protein